jgi:small subunit ribosomal protein S11
MSEKDVKQQEEQAVSPEKAATAEKAAPEKVEKAAVPEKKAASEKAEKVEAPEQEATPEQVAMSEAQAVMAEGDEPAKAADTTKKKGKGKSIPAGIAFVRSTFNNTLVSITDARGGVIAWSSAGKAGFKGSRKSTAFAATMVAQDAARQAMAKGMSEVEVRVQGAGAGRESAVRAIQAVGIQVTMIKDCTPIPHNGCRARQRRRV